AGSSGRERRERRDAGAGQVEREGEPARRSEPDADAGEAAGADAHRERVEVAGMRAALAQERVHVLEQRLRARHALAEHFAVVDERTRRNRGGRIESEHQHSAIDTLRRSPSAWRRCTAKRGCGRTPAPASGHSTNAIASSKYGSRSPHAAGDTPWKR